MKLLLGECGTNQIKEYELSRVCSLNEAKLFCDANKRTITLET